MRLYETTVTIWDLSKLVGTLEAALTAAEYVKLYMCQLQHDKKLSLKFAKENYDSFCFFTYNNSRQDNWLVDTSDTTFCLPINWQQSSQKLFSDASMIGWGGSLARLYWRTLKQNTSRISCQWIRALAAYFALKTYCKNLNSTSIQFSLIIPHLWHQSITK